MKIRTGFVSNSSSSSFIIAIKEENKKVTCHCCNSEIDTPFMEFIDKKLSSQYISFIDTSKEGLLCFCKSKGYNRIERIKKDFDEYTKKGYRILIVDIDNSCLEDFRSVGKMYDILYL